jgi:hypothetical protein
MAAGLGSGDSRLALSGSHRVFGDGDRNRHSFCLVDIIKRTA